MSNKRMGKITTGEVLIGAGVLVGIGFLLMHKPTAAPINYNLPPGSPGGPPITYVPPTYYTPPPPANTTNTAINTAGDVVNNLINALWP